MYTMANIEKATKVGILNYAKINNIVDVYENNGKIKRTYQVSQELPQKDAEEFKAEIQACFEEYKVSPEAKGKKFDDRFPARLGYEEKDGKTLFKFWTFSEYKATDTKPATKKVIPVFEVGKGPLGEKNIGNGSKGQVAYELHPFWGSSSVFGVSLIMNKVLVHELIEFGGSSDDMSVFGVDVSGANGVFSDATKSDIPEEKILF